MKKHFWVLALLVGFLIGCGSGGGGDSGGDGGGGGAGGTFTTGGGTPDREAIDNYVNAFIIPTLRSLNNSTSALQSAVSTLIAAPSDAALAAARSAWVASRVPWEQSETALFGPVEFYGFDPALDTWPVNQIDLEAVLASGEPLTQARVANLDNALKGYHTIEYLLYGLHGEKRASDLTARESEYLAAVAAELHTVTTNLLAAWISGFNGQKPFAGEITKAGQGSQVFPTEKSAVEQMARGMIVIADEVANGKIADPFDSRNPNIVESQFSGNSLADFANNIEGAKNAYLITLSDIIVAKNASVDTNVRALLDQAIAKIRAIPEPFLTAIQNSANDKTIIAAQNAVRQVQHAIEGDVLPLVLQ